jgi:hypothetical protein
MAIVGEPKYLEKIIELSDVSKWELAMQKEYKFFIANVTWELVLLLESYKVMKCKWMFCTKNNANDIVVWFKARLMAKGS